MIIILTMLVTVDTEVFANKIYPKYLRVIKKTVLWVSKLKTKFWGYKIHKRPGPTMSVHVFLILGPRYYAAWLQASQAGDLQKNIPSCAAVIAFKTYDNEKRQFGYRCKQFSLQNVDALYRQLGFESRLGRFFTQLANAF